MPKILVALQPAMLHQIDQIATVEHRTRSDLIREALRRYISEFNRTNTMDLPEVDENTVAGRWYGAKATPKSKPFTTEDVQVSCVEPVGASRCT